MSSESRQIAMVRGVLALALATCVAACSSAHTPGDDSGTHEGHDGDVADAGHDGGTAPPIWCAAYVPPPAATTDDCRSDADCASRGGACWAPGDTTGLHGGGACPMTCATDPDCPDGNVCESFNGTFCHQCVPSCTPTSCGAWEACGDDGHCHPAQCETDGWECPPSSHCAAPGDMMIDSHGCAIAVCTSDADCGCGACVEGACAHGPGRCDLPRP